MDNKEKLQKILGNPVLWIESFMKIANKEGIIVPFKLNELQADFVDKMDKYNIILKSRQLGFSVLSCALSLYYACTQSNTECLLVSYSIDSATAVFEKLKTMYNTIPDLLKPSLINNNKKELKFTNGSRIVVATAGNKELARGMTLKFVHLSEMAFWKDNADKQLLAIEQALSPTGKLVIESTANGLNYFSEIFYKAEAGENLYKSFFYNWYENKTMFKQDHEYAVNVWKSRNNGNLPSVDELDEIEKDLYSKGATIEQIVWRRLKISNGGEEKFKQEYPSNSTEAFVTTGNGVFNAEKINTRVQYLHKHIAKNELRELPSELKEYYGNSLFIYQKPIQGERYYFGVDCSEGLGQDYSVIEVFNKDYEQVAEFANNKIQPYKFAEVIYSLAKYYNNGYLVIEKASAGHSVIDKIRHDYMYMNMHKHKTYDERGKKKKKVGFETNAKTKPIMVNAFRELFDINEILINSKGLLEEMKTFVNENGKYSHMKGRHDDRIMATCMAIQGIQTGYWYV